MEKEEELDEQETNERKKRKYYDKHQDKFLKQRKRYCERYPDKIAKHKKNCRETKPEKVMEGTGRY